MIDEQQWEITEATRMIAEMLDGGRITAAEATKISAVYRNAILTERERCSKIAKRVWRDAHFYGNVEMRKAASMIRYRIETYG